MKNKFSVRVFAVVLALVLVLQGFVFAATGGEQLLKHNLIQGTGNGLAEDQIFTREQFARVVCEVLGEAEAAKAYSGKLMYADADQVSEWAKPYVAYVTDKKWMSGVGDNKFHPLGIVSEAQIGAVLLRAMGYQYSWSEISVRLFAHGIAPIKSNLKRGEAFDYIWRAIRQPIGKDGKSLLERLGKMTKEELNQADTAERIRAARTFNIIEVAEGVKKLIDGSGKEYLLVSKDAKVPAEYKNLQTVQVPVSRAFVATTPVVSYLNALNPKFLDSVVGVTTKKEEWVYPEIVSGMEKGSIAYVEQPYGAPLNAESILALKPEVVFIDGYDAEQSAKLRESLEKFGIAVLYVTEHQEQYPNALVEWVKFFGALYDAEELAKTYFEQSLVKEAEVFAKAKDIKEEQKISVAVGINFYGTVYVTGKDAAIKDQISKLGGKYVFGDIAGGSGVTITPEEFVVKAKDADVLIYTSLPQYLGGVEGMIANFPQLKEFKAYRENRIYILDRGFYMNKIDEIAKFEDILFILHPELMKGHALKMYQHLDVGK